MNTDNANNCIQCHPSCATCFAANNSNACTTCTNGRTIDTVSNVCYEPCLENQYKPTPVDPLSTNCLSCHPTCKTCRGPLETDCLSCELSRSISNPVVSGTVSLASGRTVAGQNWGTCKCLAGEYG
jgi:hypothetical protein